MSVQRQGQQSSSRSVVLNPYTVERRDVSEFWKIHLPRPKRFPSGGDFAPRGPRDCTRATQFRSYYGLLMRKK